MLPELAAAVDDVSVSLNAPNRRRYLELCLPDLTSIEAGLCSAGVRASTGRVLGGDAGLSSTRAPRHFRRVQASVVGAVLTPEEIEASRELARSLGVELFRVR